MTKTQTPTANTDFNGVCFSSGICIDEWSQGWPQELTLNIPSTTDRQTDTQIHGHTDWREWILVKATWWQSTWIDQTARTWISQGLISSCKVKESDQKDENIMEVTKDNRQDEIMSATKQQPTKHWRKPLRCTRHEQEEKWTWIETCISVRS